AESLMRALPLRVKLMAAMLALLVLGMTFVGIVSVGVMHGYLMDRVTSQADLITQRMVKKVENKARASKPGLLIESDTIVQLQRPGGRFTPLVDDRDVDQKPGPILPVNPGADAFTAQAVSGQGEWQVLLTQTTQGVLMVAVDLDEVKQITRR